MSRREIQKLIDTAPSSWKKMFKRYRLGSRPTVKKLIDTVLEYTPSGELYGEKGRAMFKPPAKVRKEAMDGLILSHDQNYTSDSGIGLVRAMQLVVEPKVSERTIKRMKSYFARSGKDTPKRLMAWLNWGGDSGKKWSDSIKTNPKRKSGTRDSKGRFVPAKYLSGYKGKDREKRIKEIDQRRTEYEKALKKYKDEKFFPKKVLDKLYRPFKTDKGIKTSKSPYTREATKRGFTGSVKEKAKAASKYYGGKIDPKILDTVNDRGMAAWASGGHRRGQTPHSWGIARVNSFLVGGKGFFTSDADQAALLPSKVYKAISKQKVYKKNPRDGVICDKKWARVCEPIDRASESLFRTLWEEGNEYVHAKSSKLPAKAQRLLDRGWIRILDRKTPSQNLYGRYFWLLGITKKGRREYNEALRQRARLEASRQIRLF